MTSKIRRAKCRILKRGDITHTLVNSSFRRIYNFKLRNREVWQKSKLEVAMDKFLFYNSHPA